MLAVVVALLSLALLYSCASSRSVAESADEPPIMEHADSIDTFVPTHPPVVVPHSWRDSGATLPQ